MNRESSENCNIDPKIYQAKMYTDKEDIKEVLKNMGVIGRTIKDIRFVGMCYNFTADSIEDLAYNYFESLGYSASDSQSMSDYHKIPADFELYRFARIDEYMLINFDSGDVFEIDCPMEGEFLIGQNSVSWYKENEVNEPNCEASVLMKPCIGRKVVNVEVDSVITDIEPMTMEKLDPKIEVVTSVSLVLDNGVKIVIEGWLDFCDIHLESEAGEILPVPFGELKEGLFNYEDMCYEKSLDFLADSQTVHFGKNGARHTDVPFITLVSNENDSRMYIEFEEDFLLMRWAITNVNNDIFDEYEDYEFRYEEWMKILAEAEKILAFSSFDDLFDYMLETNEKSKSDIIYSINSMGEDFWLNKKMYETQLKDIKKWTGFVLKQGGKMKLIGF